jgi:hypothetical protein
MRLLVFTLVLLLLAACENAATKQAQQGRELLSATFDNPGSWEVGAYPVAAEAADSTLAIVNERYQIEHRAGASASFMWGTGGGDHENVILEVETEQLSQFDDNLYGVACRLATNDQGETSGYMLLISGDGNYGIASLRNGALTFLRDWHQSGAIKRGRAQNAIRAVCVDDYLALYVNGRFLGEVKDSTYRRTGQVGLVAGVNREQLVVVAFDNLKVYEGTISDR